MALHPGNSLLGLIGQVLECMIGNKFKRRRKQIDRRRAKATAAWYARLPAARSLDDTCAARSTATNASPQPESPFFRKLPLEIRRLIYSEVLGGNELLLQVVDEIKHGYDDEVGKEKTPFELKCHTRQASISFPISCKLAYMESIDYLYTSNTFRFTGITEYWCFKRLLSRQYLDLIQDLHIQYAYIGTSLDRDLTLGTPPFNIRCWNETWDDIASLKSLAHVRIDMHRFERRVYDMDEELYFTPLKNLADQVELEVCVSWGAPLYFLGCTTAWPFVIKRGMSYCQDRNGNFSLSGQQANDQ